MITKTRLSDSPYKESLRKFDFKCPYASSLDVYSSGMIYCDEEEDFMMVSTGIGLGGRGCFPGIMDYHTPTHYYVLLKGELCGTVELSEIPDDGRIYIKPYSWCITKENDRVKKLMEKCFKEINPLSTVVCEFERKKPESKKQEQDASSNTSGVFYDVNSPILDDLLDSLFHRK